MICLYHFANLKLVPVCFHQSYGAEADDSISACARYMQQLRRPMSVRWVIFSLFRKSAGEMADEATAKS